MSFIPCAVLCRRLKTQGVLIGLLVSSLFILTGCVPDESPPADEGSGGGADSALEHAIKHLDPKYVCPMHSNIIKDEPGNCPICGMALVAKQIDPDAGKSPKVGLSPAVVQTLGVRTAKAEVGTLWRLVRTVGSVAFDETRLAHVHPRAEGWIESLKLRAEGEPVKRGQLLAELYSQEILSAQVDFLLALDDNSPGGRRVKADKARNLLRLLDVPEAVIRDIERSGETRNRVPVLSPIDGVVTGMMARDGMYVSKSSDMFTISDLSRVWVFVDVLEAQIDWISTDSTAEIRVPAYPGRKWEGKVDYLYPQLDKATRTLRARLVFDNPDQILRPNMFADVRIFGGPKRDVLKIPSEALIRTGESERVVLALGDGRFQPAEVVIGMQRGGEVEILSGLKEGDEVVISGQFLIDSESSLQAAFLRMGEE